MLEESKGLQVRRPLLADLLEAAALGLLDQVLGVLPGVVHVLQVLPTHYVDELIVLRVVLNGVVVVVLIHDSLLDLMELMLLDVYELSLLTPLEELEDVHSLHWIHDLDISDSHRSMLARARDEATSVDQRRKPFALRGMVRRRDRRPVLVVQDLRLPDWLQMGLREMAVHNLLLGNVLHLFQDDLAVVGLKSDLSVAGCLVHWIR